MLVASLDEVEIHPLGILCMASTHVPAFFVFFFCFLFFLLLFFPKRGFYLVFVTGW